MERSDIITKIVKIIIYILFVIFVIMTSLKLSNHSPTLIQIIIAGGSIFIGHQFYISGRLSKLEGKFEMFEKEFRDVKTELKNFRDEFTDFKHEMKHELRLINKSLSRITY